MKKLLSQSFTCHIKLLEFVNKTPFITVISIVPINRSESGLRIFYYIN